MQQYMLCCQKKYPPRQESVCVRLCVCACVCFVGVHAPVTVTVESVFVFSRFVSHFFYSCLLLLYPPHPHFSSVLSFFFIVFFPSLVFDVLVPPINHCMYSTFKRERENRVRKTEGQSIFCLTVRSSSRDKGLHATFKVSFMYFYFSNNSIIFEK